MAVNVDTEDPVKRTMDATGGRGVDVVLDTTPYAVDAVAQAVRMVRESGTVVLAGLKGGRPILDFSTDEIVWKRVTLKGVRGVEFAAFQRAVETIESRRYPLERLHTHSFPVEEAEKALRTLAGETGEPGRPRRHRPRTRAVTRLSATSPFDRVPGAPAGLTYRRGNSRPEQVAGLNTCRVRRMRLATWCTPSTG